MIEKILSILIFSIYFIIFGMTFCRIYLEFEYLSEYQTKAKIEREKRHKKFSECMIKAEENGFEVERCLNPTFEYK